jgi:hypothetical protein
MERDIWYGDVTRALITCSRITVPAAEMITRGGGTIEKMSDGKYFVTALSTPETAQGLITAYSLGADICGLRTIAEPEYPWEMQRKYTIAAGLAGQIKYA